MESKTDSVRREILKSIIERYGNKPKNIVVKKIKDSGVYKNFQDDNEVYELVQKFAEFHKLPFGFIEKTETIKEDEKPEHDIDEIKEKVEEVDLFYKSLEKEHAILSKKLLALNKLMETYKL